MSKTLIIGASSAIAQATAKLFAADGHRLFLVGRDIEKLKEQAQDLKVRGAEQVECHAMDALAYDEHLSTIQLATEQLGGLDLVLIAHGTLPDQKECEQSVEKTRNEFEINCVSTIS